MIREYRAWSFTVRRRTNLMFGRLTPVTTTRALGYSERFEDASLAAAFRPWR